jgi:peroxiredoxin Q/BCP
MAAVSAGAKVPRFTLPTTGGDYSVGAESKENLVVYFYPRDNTPGCTMEGSDFRDLAPSFRRINTRILGVSTDSLDSHRRFREKMKFPFELGSDEDHAVAELFGVWKRKTLYGRTSMGIERSTFLIDAKGVLRREWRKVRVAGHAAEVLAAAREL